MKTPMAKIGDVTPRWYVVDATEERLGRAAAIIARMLQGKHRPTYTPHTDTGDFIVLINAADIQVTGKKNNDKIYDWYTGYPGGRKTRTLAEMRQRRPEQVIKLAVRRMLPKTRLGKTLPLPVINLAGKTGLLQAAAVLAQAQLFVGNDSGLGHIAAATGTQTATVFGPGDPARYHPWHPQARWIQSSTGSIEDIAVDTVTKEVLAILGT